MFISYWLTPTLSRQQRSSLRVLLRSHQALSVPDRTPVRSVLQVRTDAHHDTVIPFLRVRSTTTPRVYVE